MIKKYYLPLICLFINTVLCAQTNGIQKIWAWEVTSVGGAQIDPSMGVEQPKNIYHIIYLETKPTAKIENITIWLKNSFVYTAKTQKVTSYPVTFSGSKDVLIKKNTNQLWECVLNKIDVLLTPEKIKNLFKLNEIVIEYSTNKKNYYSVLKAVGKKTQQLM
jgi:hypothetical protein